jgi:hypothetical protein
VEIALKCWWGLISDFATKLPRSNVCDYAEELSLKRAAFRHEISVWNWVVKDKKIYDFTGALGKR